MNVHIKDFTVRRTSNKIGFLVEGAPAGAGDLDLPGMVRRLRALPRSVSLILEQWPPFVRDISATVANEDEWARRSIECLRKTIGADDPIEVFSGSPQSAHR
jgi:sugar phosphate isomerase/epimerase